MSKVTVKSRLRNRPQITYTLKGVETTEVGEEGVKIISIAVKVIKHHVENNNNNNKTAIKEIFIVRVIYLGVVDVNKEVRFVGEAEVEVVLVEVVLVEAVVELVEVVEHLILTLTIPTILTTAAMETIPMATQTKGRLF